MIDKTEIVRKVIFLRKVGWYACNS
jgi:hypothetical protein